MTDVEIWHNPRCSKSRAALELIRAKGIEPRVVLYLEAPPSAARIAEVLGLLGMQPRELMREGEAVFRELGLRDVTEREALLGALVENPILVERPIVLANGRAVVARPPERALEVL